VSSPGTPKRPLPNMGCFSGKPAPASHPAQTAKQETSPAPPVPEATAEEKAVAQLKVLFESLCLDNGKTRTASVKINGKWTTAVDRDDFQKAMSNNDKIGDLIKEANLNPDSQVLGQMDTNKDGLVSWEEFEEHLKSAAVSQVEKSGNVAAATESVEKKAETRLRELFDSIDTNKDETVNRDELAAKLDAAGSESFISLLKEAGLATEFAVLDQIDANKDGRISWKEFYDALSQAAKAEVQATGDVPAAPEPALPVIEDEGATKNTCC